jgi:three-Cys-motif partner protein
MPRGQAKKTDDEFFEISLSSLDKGKKLISVYPEVVDEYNDHSLLKLISITYWVGIFTPIAHRRLKERYDYEVVYVDTMAGSGVTCTKRAGDYLCGSCPAAVEAALKKGFPFDRVIGVEINAAKAKALKSRLKLLCPDQQILIYNKDILEISPFIKKEIKSSSISYIVIDPQALQGMTWEAIGPLLKCKGDAMVTWFEDTVWRLKQAALSDCKSSKGDGARLTELLGSQKWKTAQEPADLTTLFINRVLSETKKIEAREVEIIDYSGKHYKMILFVGRCKEANRIADEWKKHMEKRLGSDKGRNIARLLDVKAGRQTNLQNFS